MLIADYILIVPTISVDVTAPASLRPRTGSLGSAVSTHSLWASITFCERGLASNIQSLACEQSEPLVAKQLTWNKTRKDNPTPPPKSRRQGSLRSSATITESNEDDDMGTSDGPQTSSATENLGLTKVSIDDVEIIESLGYGHNGVVYSAKWGGRKVALKQFDVGKDGYEYFDKELAAYLAPKGA